MRRKKTTSKKVKKAKKGTSKARKSGTRKAAPRKKAAKKAVKKKAVKPRTTRARRAKKAAPAREPEQIPARVIVEVLPNVESLESKPEAKTPESTAPESITPTSAKPESLSPASAKPESTKPENGLSLSETIPDSVILLDADEMESGKSRKQPASSEKTGGPRPNRLVPTNAVHPTERRVRRRETYGRAAMLMAAVAMVGLFILSDDGEPLEMAAFEQSGGVSMDSSALETAGEVAPRYDNPLSAEAADSRFSNSDQTAATNSNEHSVRITVPFDQGTVALLVPSDDSGETPEPGKLSADEITEMERMLARLDLGSNLPDGVFDMNTASAIRLYQEIAGLPVDGEPSQELLTDMREVVKILDSDG